jgi:hypothetical protein
LIAFVSVLACSIGLAGTLVTAEAAPPPTVNAVGPNAGPNTGTTNVKIIGANFQSGATATVGSSGHLTTSFVSSNTLLVNPPNISPAFGASRVVVTNPDGMSSTQNVFFNYFEGLPSGAATSLAAVANPNQPQRMDVFIKGSDNGLWHTFSANNDGHWSSWSSLGGILSSAPTAVSWQDGSRIDVFIRGTDNGLWHKWWDGTRWNGWEGLGGILSSDPGGVSWGPPDRRVGPPPAPRIDVFVRGTDNALWHKWWDSVRWNGWEGLGGSLASAPAASATEVGDLEVFSLSPTSPPLLMHLPFFGSWLGWRSEGFAYWVPQWTFGVGTVAASILTGVDVFTVSADGSVWHTQLPGADNGFGARPQTQRRAAR